MSLNPGLQSLKGTAHIHSVSDICRCTWVASNPLTKFMHDILCLDNTYGWSTCASARSQRRSHQVLSPQGMQNIQNYVRLLLVRVHRYMTLTSVHRHAYTHIRMHKLMKRDAGRSTPWCVLLAVKLAVCRMSSMLFQDLPQQWPRNRSFRWLWR